MNHSVRRGALKGQGPLPVPSLRAEWSGSSLLRIYARLPSGGGQASLPRLRLQAAPSLAAVEALEWVDLPIEGSIENDSATFDVTAAFQDGWRFFRLIGP